MSILGVPVSTVMAVMNGTPPISLYAMEAVEKWRDAHIDNPFSKYMVAELAFGGISIFSALETLANAVNTLILKGVSFFVLDKAEFETSRLQPQINYTIANFLMLNVALLTLKENFNPEALGNKAYGAVAEFYTKP